jgi:hypothetical protein
MSNIHIETKENNGIRKQYLLTHGDADWNISRFLFNNEVWFWFPTDSLLVFFLQRTNQSNI